jgi:uncharacterized protein
MNRRAAALVRSLKLQPHPEGGFFREVFRSEDTVEARQGLRSALTTIYFLLTKGQVSRFHRVTSDEIWHFYEGAPLRLHYISPDFKRHESLQLGPCRGKRAPYGVIPAGAWQAAETTGDYTLVGCTVGPGFDFADFTMLRDAKDDAATLVRRHPRWARLV